MRLRPAILTLALAAAGGAAHADEGMWMPSQLPQLAKELKAAGFKGNPADLADLTKHPMSAVVSLGGCTASFVSAAGAGGDQPPLRAGRDPAELHRGAQPDPGRLHRRHDGR